MGEVGAIVLGGGRGTRLYPLTALRAKPAVPLLGRYRLVDIPLSLCIHAGIKRIVVLTQFNSASLHRHIHNSYHFDNFSRGFVEILAAEQTIDSGDWYQGTADAIRKQLRHVCALNARHYLILSGDQLYQMDYRNLLQTHLRNGAEITVATLPVDRDRARSLGIMKVAPRGRVHAFVEKPSTDPELDALALPGAAAGAAYLASMGVYVFRAEVLREILEQHTEWNDFGKHVIPNVVRRRRVFAHRFNGFWEDIGTVRSYYEIHLKMVGPNPPFPMFQPGRLIYTHPRYLPGSRIDNVTARHCILCEGCRITNAELTQSLIGIRGVIRNGVSLRRTIMMGADYLEDAAAPGIPPLGIGDGSQISGAIIDKNARIGRNVVIRGTRRLHDCDRDSYAVRDGIVVVLKNAVIPDGARIE